jgi:hypothetical protein
MVLIKSTLSHLRRQLILLDNSIAMRVMISLLIPLRLGGSYRIRRDETLLVAPSNKLRQGINTEIRNTLVEEGKIKKGGINFTAYENRGLTVAQLKYYRNYTPGNVLMFAKGYKRMV